MTSGAQTTALHGILVTYRRPADLGVMLCRLAEQQRRLDTLVVVDNDPGESARGPVERYAGTRRAATYLPSGRNLGPAGGIALGMRHVLGYAAPQDWLVLLDDDDPPRMPEDLRLLEQLGNRLRAVDPGVAAVGSSGSGFNLGTGRIVRVPDSALCGAVPTSCIGGNQLPLYSVHAVREAGVFDERLFFGFDDLEYGLRLRASGYRIYAHGELWRRNRAQAGRTGLRGRPGWTLDEPTWRRYYSLRNLIVILRRHRRPVTAVRLAARSVAKPMLNLPRSPRRAVRHLRLTCRAIGDAYLGHMGLTVAPQAKR